MNIYGANKQNPDKPKKDQPKSKKEHSLELNMEKLAAVDLRKAHVATMVWSLSEGKTMRVVVEQYRDEADISFSKWDEAKLAYIIFKQFSLPVRDATKAIIKQFTNLGKEIIDLQVCLVEDK